MNIEKALANGDYLISSSMSTKKKRQHYVWRHYLKAWSHDENIWTFFRDQNKILKPGLMGVAQERYFYKLATFSEHEENFLKKFIEHSCHHSVKALCLDFVDGFTQHYKMQKTLDEKVLSPSDRNKLQEIIDNVEANMLEDVHCRFEGHGCKLLAGRRVEDFEFLDDPDMRNSTLIFLSVQYFRTRKMKNEVLKRYFGTEQGQVERYWGIISLCLALNVTAYMAVNQDVKFLLLENQTTTSFMTSDQPIFNILSDKLDEHGNVLELEWFYPITPQLALSVRFDSKQSTRYTIAGINEGMVNYFNSKVLENSDYFLFADKEEQLRPYLLV